MRFRQVTRVAIASKSDWTARKSRVSTFGSRGGTLNRRLRSESIIPTIRCLSSHVSKAPIESLQFDHVDGSPPGRSVKARNAAEIQGRAVIERAVVGDDLLAVVIVLDAEVQECAKEQADGTNDRDRCSKLESTTLGLAIARRKRGLGQVRSSRRILCARHDRGALSQGVQGWHQDLVDAFVGNHVVVRFVIKVDHETTSPR